MGLLALAIAPGIAICIFIYLKDKYNKEPIGMLVLAFFLGMLSILPAVIIQVTYTKIFGEQMGQDLLYVAIFAFLVVAISEEGSKLMVLRLFFYSRKAFDDPFDGIMYAIMVGMGFATLENIGYVYQQGMETAITRMFLSVPAHGTFAVLMGYYVGLAKFDTARRGRYFFFSLLFPVLFHGSFDFFLFSGIAWLQVIGALASFVIAIRLSLKAIRRKQLLARDHFNGVDSITGKDNALF